MIELFSIQIRRVMSKIIAEFEKRDDTLVTIFKLENNNYSVEDNRIFPQENLNADEIIRYLAWRLQATEYSIKKLSKG
jgi:hypothetical protein